MNRTATIGIVTALPDTELPATLRAFGISSKAKPIMREGDRYWQKRVKSVFGDDFLVVITCIGGSGNTDAGIVVERFNQRFRPELVIFVGIGCGLSKYALGDVCTSAAIWAYEYVKTTPKGALDRSRAQMTASYVRDDVSFFVGVEEWHDSVTKCCKKVNQKALPRQIPSEPALHRHVFIASGEKVLANGELAKLNAIHDLIRVGEMEGYGFATACQRNRTAVPWLVIRGISDYGDPSKNGFDPAGPQKDEYHLYAAQTAACFAATFLRHSYTSHRSAGVPATSRSEADTAATMLVPQDGIQDLYTSDHDPRFSSELVKRIASARRTIVIVGMGLSFLKGNVEYVRRIRSALKRSPRLTVRIYYGAPGNDGLRARLSEEQKARSKLGKPYRKNWPTEYLKSLCSLLKTEIGNDYRHRVSLYLTDCLPTVSIVRVDEAYFWYPYGTPDIPGKESPWMLVDEPTKSSALRFFLQRNLDYYQISSTQHTYLE